MRSAVNGIDNTIPDIDVTDDALESVAATEAITNYTCGCTAVTNCPEY